MIDTNTEEAREYTKVALMRMSKSELIEVAGEVGVDLGILPKLTKELISDAIMVFLEPYLDDGVQETNPIEPNVGHADEKIETIPMKGKRSTELRVSKPEPATVGVPEVKRHITTQTEIVGIAITSRWPGHLVVSDSPSNRTYVWGEIGATITVAKEDVDHVMSKNRSPTRGCCGSSGGHIYFVLA